MKIYTTDKFDCPYCKGSGEIELSNPSNNPENNDWTECPKCNGTGEMDNKKQQYEAMRKLSFDFVSKSAEMAKLASKHYNKILQECLDMNFALSSSNYVEEKARDNFESFDVECQELNAMFEDFDKKRTTFLEMLDSCSCSDDFADADDFDIDSFIHQERLDDKAENDSSYQDL